MSDHSGSGDEVAGVRGFWERLGLPGLVDVHTHFMPESVLRKVWAYFDALGPLTAGVEWPITYRHEEDERAALLREFGVRAFTAMLYPHKPGMAPWLNSWAVDFARRTPDCLHTSTLFPEPGVETYVREGVEADARVFKAHVQVGAYDPADALLDPSDHRRAGTARGGLPQRGRLFRPSGGVRPRGTAQRLAQGVSQD